MPVVARCKAWVCDRSLAGIAGTNAAGTWMTVSCVLSGTGLCVAAHPCRRALPSVLCLSVMVKPQYEDTLAK